MKLLMFIHSLQAGGAERVAANLANYWQSQGWVITVVTLAPADMDFYQLHSGIERISLNLTSNSSGPVIGLWHNAMRVRALRRVLRQTLPDIALAMMSASNVLLALAARGLPGIHPVGAEHTYPPQMPLGTLWERLRRHTYGDLQAVVALTQECAHWLKQNSSARYVPVIPNAAVWPLVDQAPMVLPDTVCDVDKKTLLAVGRLSEEKNFAALIAIFAELAPDYPDWNLVILGEGPERQALESQVATSGLIERVFLPGRVGNVGKWYGRADLYVMASRFEGFPNTLVEAMSHGLAAVSVDCDTGPRDIIRHGVDGMLVPPGDVSSLQNALRRLMGNSGLRATYATRAIEVRDRFSIQKISAQWEGLFDKCMQEKTLQAVPEGEGINERHYS